jgi:hypothetical protein
VGSGVGPARVKVRLVDPFSALVLIGVECTTLAVRAQACLNEVFRVMGPYEDRMGSDDDVRESYAELKKMGVLHASKFVNILNSGMPTTDRIAKITKTTLERQETTFGHLTRVAVLVQRYVPICEKEAERAKKVRDETRAEVADKWKEQVAQVRAVAQN